MKWLNDPLQKLDNDALVCPAETSGSAPGAKFLCTLYSDHAGPHVAQGLGYAVHAIWDDEDSLDVHEDIEMHDIHERPE